MIPVLTKDQAYKLDKDTIGSGHLSQAELMDNAGNAVAQFFCEKIKYSFNQNVVVVCGNGNNGGDGVIAHSYLKKYNVSSKIVFTEEKHGHSNLIKKYKISKNDYSIYNDKINFDRYDWIIDGIFGIGLSRKLNNKYKKIINQINFNNQIISIDVPSGIYVDNNKSNCFIRSTHLLTLGYSKIGNYLNSINSITIKNIGFKSISSNMQLIQHLDILNILKPYYNKCNIHKYSKGKCFIFGGSRSYPGASILCSMAALKTGSGYIDLFYKKHSKDLASQIDIILPEVVITENYLNFADTKTPILIGPGNANIKDISTNHINKNPIVVDGGAIKNNLNIKYYPSRSIFTPHLGELKRFKDIDIDKFINYELFNLIQKRIDNKIMILKSFNTYIITNNMIYIMDNGPSILSTAGTGDVLSGILVSLLSQGYSRLDASILGTYLHAEAANYYMNNISKDGMTASDLINCIPYAFNKLREND